MEVVASLSQGRTASAQCGFFTHKSVPVIFEPPCTQKITTSSDSVVIDCCYLSIVVMYYPGVSQIKKINSNGIELYVIYPEVLVKQYRE